MIVRAAHQALSRKSGALRVLEIGCGTGANLVAMAASQSSTSFVGLEPDGGIGAELSSRHPAMTIVRGTLAAACEQLKALGPYDLILLSHVLEHFPDPVDALRTVRSMVAPDGHLLTVVPDLGILTPFHDQFTVPHTHYFSRRTFEAVHRSAGFEPIGFIDDQPGELCALSAPAVSVQWDGTSDVDFVNRRFCEPGRLRARVRSAARTLLELALPESTVSRLREGLSRVVRRWPSCYVRIGLLPNIPLAGIANMPRAMASGARRT